MPTYAYVCTACDHSFEAVQAITDDSLTACPSCGGVLRKKFHPVGVTFKGSGFYRTDSRRGESGSTSASPKEAASGSGSGSSTETSSGSKDPGSGGANPSKGSSDSSGSSNSGSSTSSSSGASKAPST